MPPVLFPFSPPFFTLSPLQSHFHSLFSFFAFSCPFSLPFCHFPLSIPLATPFFYMFPFSCPFPPSLFVLRPFHSSFHSLFIPFSLPFLFPFFTTPFLHYLVLIFIFICKFAEDSLDGSYALSKKLSIALTLSSFCPSSFIVPSPFTVHSLFRLLFHSPFGSLFHSSFHSLLSHCSLFIPLSLPFSDFSLFVPLLLPFCALSPFHSPFPFLHTKPFSFPCSPSFFTLFPFYSPVHSFFFILSLFRPLFLHSPFHSLFFSPFLFVRSQEILWTGLTSLQEEASVDIIIRRKGTDGGDDEYYVVAGAETMLSTDGVRPNTAVGVPLIVNSTRVDEER